MTASAQKPFVIRDPLHGYITVAAHERIVIDDPITQRLRRVTQTGLAEFVFPEARTSRFVHSIGTTHLASRFVISAIENGNEDAVENFFSEIEALPFFTNFQIKHSDLDSLLFKDRGGGGLLSARVAFPNAKFRTIDYQRLLALVEAGTRLAALFHDLGHLPFSHDFEFALKDFVASKIGNAKSSAAKMAPLLSGAPHEKIGHILAQLVFKSLVEAANPDPATRASFALALEILNREERCDEVPIPLVSALGWLHSLVDGQIDADRADYLLRDARALGLEFANYDLDRLVSNLVLISDSKLGYVTVIDERGFSALESYCLSRSRSNAILTRHHKTAQFAAALRYASVAGLNTPQAEQFVDDLSELASGRAFSESEARKLLARFSAYDDGWWLGVLRNTQPKGDAVLAASLELVLNRKSGFSSIWKRRAALGAATLTGLNSFSELSRKEPELFQKIRQRLIKTDGILIVLHKFVPYSTRVGSRDGDSIFLIWGQHLSYKDRKGRQSCFKFVSTD